MHKNNNKNEELSHKYDTESNKPDESESIADYYAHKDNNAYSNKS